MKNAILVPGRPDKEEYLDPGKPTESNDHWFPWLSKQLMVNDIFTVAVEMPVPWQPRYEVWKKEFERYDIGEDTLLVGHSCGGGFLVRWLSENKDVRVGKVVLVAPWMNPENDAKYDTADFFHFEIDSGIVNKTKGITIFNSDNDGAAVVKTVAMLREKVKDIGYREFQNYGHFCKEDLHTTEFPELLEELLAT